MKTLFVNPPSFEKFDGGASARYQATREITSFWYPVWLAYPAGLVRESRLLDGPAQGISPDDTVAIARDYEFVVLYTSMAGFASDIQLAERIKAGTPGIKIAFVGPHVTARAEVCLQASSAIDFVVRGEFDYPVAEFADGRRLEDIAGVSHRRDGRIMHNLPRQPLQDLDVLPFAVDVQAGPNGKVNNLLGGIRDARHDILVISDSDVRVRPDYLRTVVAPLAEPQVGCVCTLFKVVEAHRWFERLELLTMNADFIPNVIFAQVTGASQCCLGQSFALRRSTLQDVGGLESLADFLVEDYELGRRIWTSGRRLILLPYFVDVVVDFQSFRQWWDHQCYWDQNTWAARPFGFLATVVTRAIPFALLFALMRLGDAVGFAALGIALALRLATVGGMLQGGSKTGKASEVWRCCRCVTSSLWSPGPRSTPNAP
jgi:hypothetical protein